VVGVVVVLALLQRITPVRRGRVRPVSAAGTVGDVLDRPPAGAVESLLGDQAARVLGLEHLAAMVPPGIRGQGTGGDSAGALVDAKDLRLVCAALVVEAVNGLGPQHAGRGG